MAGIARMTVLAGIVSALSTTLALAQSPQPFPRAYLGVGVGKGSFSLPSATGKIGAAVVSTSMSKETSAAASLYAGYRFDEHWGVEIGYADLGSGHTYALTTSAGSGTASVGMHSLYAAAVGTADVGGGFGLIAKLGLTRNLIDVGSACVAATCTAPPGPGDHYSVLWGAGAEYSWNGRYGVRLEYQDFGKSASGDAAGTGNSGALKASAWTLSAKAIF